MWRLGTKTARESADRRTGRGHGAGQGGGGAIFRLRWSRVHGEVGREAQDADEGVVFGTGQKGNSLIGTYLAQRR